VTKFQCAHCSASFPSTTLMWQCSQCGGPLDAAELAPLRKSDIASERRSLWRYQKALVYRGPVTVSLGEGWTPLVNGKWNDVAVQWKCEFVSISGSFKDRGVAVMMNQLIANGVSKVAEDSSGNGGAAVATYAAAAGLPCRIYVPAHTSPGKITQIAASGAEVIRIGGSRQAVADAAMADQSGYFYASHNWDPGFLDGIKTVGYELWEQLGFRAPDVVIAPVGSGSNFLGCFRAFQDLLRTGEIERLPRLYGAQSQSCEPLARGFAAGAETYLQVESRASLAEGIAVSEPIRAPALLRAARETGGGIYSVTERAIGVAQQRLARQGLYVEPTSATAAALLEELLARGAVRSGETIAVILTGSGLKAGELIAQLEAAAT